MSESARESLKHDFVLIDRLIFTVIGIVFLIDALYALSQNSDYYIVASSIGLYLGHTRVLLILAPLFIYYAWKYNPILAPVYMALFYALHEFIFNIFFLFYYWPATSSSMYWGNYIFLFEILASVALSLVSIRFKFFNPFRSKYAKIATIAFFSFVAVWILGFHFVVTNNYAVPQANAANAYALLPNALELLYNLTFAAMFFFSVSLYSTRNSVVQPTH